MNDLNDKEAMVLVLIGMANVDSKIDQLEKAWLTKIILKYGRVENQNYLLDQITHYNSSYIESFKKIDSLIVLNQTLSYCRYILNIDNEFSNNERIAYQQIMDLYKDKNPKADKFTKSDVDSLLTESGHDEFSVEMDKLKKALTKKYSYVCFYSPYKMYLYFRIFYDFLTASKYSFRFLLLFIAIVALIIFCIKY